MIIDVDTAKPTFPKLEFPYGFSPTTAVSLSDDSITNRGISKHSFCSAEWLAGSVRAMLSAKMPCVRAFICDLHSPRAGGDLANLPQHGCSRSGEMQRICSVRSPLLPRRPPSTPADNVATRANVAALGRTWRYG